jgi:antirestriction protein ArdC
MSHRFAQSSRPDVYTRITDDIIAAIENGAGEWQMPWHHDGTSTARPRNIASDKAYRGINVLALWAAAHRARWTSGIWGTYRQWAERGCQVRRGERATTVVSWKQLGRPDHAGPSTDDPSLSDHDERGERPRFFARGYHVFMPRCIPSINFALSWHCAKRANPKKRSPPPSSSRPMSCASACALHQCRRVCSTFTPRTA